MPRTKPKLEEASANLDRQRLDKWLCAARFFKTRALAVIAIEAGHVRVSGLRAKPAREIKAGDSVWVERDGLAWDIDVLRLSARRGPASEAITLYRELDSSRLARDAAIAQRSANYHVDGPNKGRPTKRIRRTLDRLIKGAGRSR